MGEPFLILGASVRAAAQSARAAGLTPVAGDLFADADLREIARAERVERYPNGLEAVARREPPGSWMYTGGVENHPDLVDRISRRHRLLGNPGGVLRAVRDPARLHAVLVAAGLPALEISNSAAGLPRDGSWLRKPRRSCGGIGITRLTAESIKPRNRNPDSDYFQAYVAGQPQSAVFLACRTGTILCGVTRQLIGSPTAGDSSSAGAAFRYLGSIGPLPPSDSERAQWNRIGSELASRFGLVGLFGVDAVLAAGTIWPVEVNPRYTASVELLERACNWSAVGNHVAACCGLESAGPPELQHPTPLAKAVLFARREVRFTRQTWQHLREACSEETLLDVADIPVDGTRIKAGHPICTVFSREDGDGRSLRSALRTAEEIVDPANQ